MEEMTKVNVYNVSSLANILKYNFAKKPAVLNPLRFMLPSAGIWYKK